MKKSVSKKVEFRLAAEPGSDVAVAGSFNDWDPKRHPMKHNPKKGFHMSVIALPPGKHEYKFVVDGEWRMDPTCGEWVPNTHGTLNSVVIVPA